ncbi:Trigger factor-like protein TIG [Platanthera zijinensis]|uniref:Trigger factor-like protein TIG n=1 Tax=Platanthera zijinensis TaxID=2320716 RepID=A0AAP0G0A0_9ASPA
MGKCAPRTQPKLAYQCGTERASGMSTEDIAKPPLEVRHSLNTWKWFSRWVDLCIPVSFAFRSENEVRNRHDGVRIYGGKAVTVVFMRLKSLSWHRSGLLGAPDRSFPRKIRVAHHASPPSSGIPRIHLPHRFNRLHLPRRSSPPSPPLLLAPISSATSIASIFRRSSPPSPPPLPLLFHWRNNISTLATPATASSSTKNPRTSHLACIRRPGFYSFPMVECKELFYRDLPELDDSLAETLLPGSSSLNQVRESLLQRCKEVEHISIEQATDNAILDQLSKIVEVVVPQSLFEEQGRELYGAKLLQLQALSPWPGCPHAQPAAALSAGFPPKMEYVTTVSHKD